MSKTFITMDQTKMIKIKANANFKAKFRLMMFVLFGIPLLRNTIVTDKILKLFISPAQTRQKYSNENTNGHSSGPTADMLKYTRKLNDWIRCWFD